MRGKQIKYKYIKNFLLVLVISFPADYTMAGKKVNQVKETKDLGLIIDEGFTHRRRVRKDFTWAHIVYTVFDNSRT